MISPSIILTEEKLQEVVDYFLTQGAFAFDIESQGDNREVAHLASVSWLSLATKGMAVAIPFGHPIGDKIIGETKRPEKYKSGKKIGQIYYKTVPQYEGAPDQLDPATVFRIVRPLFFNPSIRKGGHDVVYDLACLAKYFGAVPPGPYFDTKIQLWLLDENRKRLGLKERINEHFGFQYDFENIGARVEDHPFSLVGYYSYCDAKYTWLEYTALNQKIQEQDLGNIYHLEMLLLNTMVGMKLAGARVDLDRLKELQVTLKKKLVECESAIYTAAGHKFNVNSTPQKQEVLYTEQGLRPWKLTATGLAKSGRGLPLTIKDYSTDDDVLASYPENAVAAAIREYGDVAKLLSTYITGWLGDENKPTLIYDGHIHAGFMQYGTVTGRFSCRTPNLQNIPRPSSDLGRLVRGIFIADEGGKLVVADYSQIELVILAHYIGEGKLFEAFELGIDPHLMTAAMVLGKEPYLCDCSGPCTKNHVTKVERQDLGKTLGFAVVYGAGLSKVASMAHVSVQEAKRVLKKHEEMFPEIHDFKQDVINLSRSRRPVPYITTLLGRKRRIPELNSSIRGVRAGAERQLFNSLIQGGAADLLKLAMVRADALLPPEIQLILTVHDEIVLSSPDYLADDAVLALEEAMTGPDIQKLVKVPLKIDIHTVTRWSDAK